MKMIVETVDQGKNVYWLTLKCLFPAIDNSRIYEFEFCGTEFNGNAPLAEEDREKFKELLCSRFGYAPYTKIPKMKEHEVFDTRTEITES